MQWTSEQHRDSSPRPLLVLSWKLSLRDMTWWRLLTEWTTSYRFPGIPRWSPIFWQRARETHFFSLLWISRLLSQTTSLPIKNSTPRNTHNPIASESQIAYWRIDYFIIQPPLPSLHNHVFTPLRVGGLKCCNECNIIIINTGEFRWKLCHFSDYITSSSDVQVPRSFFYKPHFLPTFKNELQQIVW